jgi:hypothetical protein
MTIKVVKLIDNTEVVFTSDDSVPLNDRDPNKLIMVKPLVLNLIPTERGVQVALAPFAFGAKESQQEFEINSSLILCVYDVRPELENAYREQTGGIVLAKGMPAQSIVDVVR